MALMPGSDPSEEFSDRRSPAPIGVPTDPPTWFSEDEELNLPLLSIRPSTEPA
jgi:hypothetical protein